MKTPNPRIELPYTYLMAWYVLYCPPLMTAVPSSVGFVPFMQKLENSSWTHYYMFFIRKSILNILNYQLDRCFPRSLVHLTGINLPTLRDQMISQGCHRESSGG